MNRIQWDWKINLTHVFTITSCFVTGLFAYTDLKSDVRNDRTTAAAKFAEYDRQWIAQRQIDDGLDQRMQRALLQLDSSIRELKADVRSDLKELRSDLARPQRPYAPYPSGYPGSVPAPRVPAPRDTEHGG